MRLHPLASSALAVCALALPAAAQQCGSGTTTAQAFIGGNGQAGNMFDIAPTTDMLIECLDVHHDEPAGTPFSLEVYYAPVTSVGNGTNSGAWTLIATGNATSAGPGTGSRVDISGNGMTFQSGQTYGICILLTSGTDIDYTNGGPTTFNGTHCSLTTQYGVSAGFGNFFSPREWNGVLYTEVAGPQVPTISINGPCPGPSYVELTNMTPTSYAYLNWARSAGSTVLAGSPCPGTVLDMNAPRLLAILETDANGDFSLPLELPPVACNNFFLQALDSPTCTPTNLLPL